jgi:hypothetical protein
MSLSDVWNRVLDEPLSSDEITQDAFAFSVLAGDRIYRPGDAARGGSWTPAAFKPV